MGVIALIFWELVWAGDADAAQVVPKYFLVKAKKLSVVQSSTASPLSPCHLIILIFRGGLCHQR